MKFPSLDINFSTHRTIIFPNILQKIISDQCGFLREFCGQDPYAKCLAAVFAMCCSPSALSLQPQLGKRNIYELNLFLLCFYLMENEYYVRHGLDRLFYFFFYKLIFICDTKRNKMEICNLRNKNLLFANGSGHRSIHPKQAGVLLARQCSVFTYAT